MDEPVDLLSEYEGVEDRAIGADLQGW